MFIICLLAFNVGRSQDTLSFRSFNYSIFFTLVSNSCNDSLDAYIDMQTLFLLDVKKDSVQKCGLKSIEARDTMHFMIPSMMNESIDTMRLFIDSSLVAVFLKSKLSSPIHYFPPMGSLRVDLPQTNTWMLVDREGLPVLQGRGNGVNHWLILDDIVAFTSYNEYITRNLFKQTIIILNKR